MIKGKLTMFLWFWLLVPSVFGQGLDRASLQRFLEDPAIRSASVSLIFYEAETGKVLLDHNSDVNLIPASSHKLLVTSTILAALGADYRYQTYLEHTGSINAEGVLEGNLIIRGGGDPSLGSDVAGALSLQALDHLLLGVIERAGIKKISGSVLVDAQYFSGEVIPASWSTSDVGNYYGAGTWGFNIHQNLYYLDFLQKAKGQRPVIQGTRPAIDGLTFTNQLSCAGAYSGDNAYIYGGPGEWDKLIKGTIPSGSGIFTIKGSIPDPASFYAKHFCGQLNQAGIAVDVGEGVLNYDIPASDKTLLYLHQSPTLAHLVEYANLESDNMFCETFLMTLGKLESGSGSRAEGIQYLRTYFSEHGYQTSFNMEDGSGLSRANRISAGLLADVLYAALTNESTGAWFYQTLPQTGVRGTLSKVFKDTPDEMRLTAKTGSMRGIRSLTGHFYTKNEKPIVFSIIINDYRGNGYAVWKKMESFLTNLYIKS